MATFRGAENDHFLVFILEPCFERALGAHFCDFDSLLGSLLETILVTFGVPFLHRFLDTLKTSKSEAKGERYPPSNGHCPPPSSDSYPLVKPLRGAPEKTPHAQAEPELSGTADICPVSTEDIYPVSTEDITVAGRRPAAVASSVPESSGSAWACGVYQELPAGV